MRACEQQNKIDHDKVNIWKSFTFCVSVVCFSILCCAHGSYWKKAYMCPNERILLIRCHLYSQIYQQEQNVSVHLNIFKNSEK